MSGGLTLSLKPREKFLVGGCLLENGPKKSSIKIVDDHVRVLRLSDALHPDEVKTPVTRAYHVAQLILACEVAEQAGKIELLERLEQLRPVFAKTPAAEAMDRAVASAEAGRYHAVLSALKLVIGVEVHLLEHLIMAQQAATRELAEDDLPRAASAR